MHLWTGLILKKYSSIWVYVILELLSLFVMWVVQPESVADNNYTRNNNISMERYSDGSLCLCYEPVLVHHRLLSTSFKYSDHQVTPMSPQCKFFVVMQSVIYPNLSHAACNSVMSLSKKCPSVSTYEDPMDHDHAPILSLNPHVSWQHDWFWSLHILFLQGQHPWGHTLFFEEASSTWSDPGTCCLL